MSARIHHARLLSRRNLAEATDEFVLAHDESELRFRPGQFISVEVGTELAPDPPPASEPGQPLEAERATPILRSYSIASLPERRGELALILRLIDGGAGSRFFDRLRPGERLRFTGPMGFFVNELEHPGDVVYVATGTGLAPFLPMLDETLRRPESGRVHLFWGLRNERDLFCQDELAALTGRHGRLSCQIYLSQPQGAAPWRLRGRVTGPVVELLPSLRAPTFYLCGNGQMIEELKRGLVDRGVNRKRQIRTEAFFD